MSVAAQLALVIENARLAERLVAEERLQREFALRAVKQAGVASIPVSALYAQEPVDTILRLCFAKQDPVLDEGVARLAKARELGRRR